MGSYLPLSSPTLASKLRVRTPVVFTPWKDSRACRFSRKRRFVFALGGKLEASWTKLNGVSDDDGYGGWSVLNVDPSDRTGLQKFVVARTGTWVVAILLAALAYCSYSRKGIRLKLSSPFGLFRVFSVPFSSSSKGTFSSTESVTPIQEATVEATEYKPAVLRHENKEPASEENICKFIPIPADPIQLEAFSALQMLKIIDYGTSADDLCTRREFAKWLVQANCMLERKAEHRMVPTLLHAGKLSPAFDDVKIEDPYFWCIQALGEAGIVSSRLSSSNSISFSGVEQSNEKEKFYFFPNKFISRLDLLNWRSILEYSLFSELKEESRYQRSIVRRTFGNIRRLQPDKPVTKAQAAVALCSGRMAGEVRAELSRLEEERLSKLAEMEQIKLELIRRGAVQIPWEEKASEQKKLALQVHKNLECALFDLEIARADKNDRLIEFMNEKVALEFRQQMISSLKKEVDEMSQELGNERANFMSEKQILDSQLKDLCEEKDAVLECKSVLEAEKDAVQLLRSWVEEEAWHIRAKADVLELAARRWKAGRAAVPEQ